MRWAPWEGATHCTGAPEPGAMALLAWIRENYTVRSGGIYNCRTVVGSTTSTHGEGRAVDIMTPTYNGRPTAYALEAGNEIISRLGEFGPELQVQCVIFNRRIYSASSPNGREYTGTHPHYDHLHIELTRQAGNRLTLATCRFFLDAKEVEDVKLNCRWVIVSGSDVNLETVKKIADGRGMWKDAVTPGEMWVHAREEFAPALVKQLEGFTAFIEHIRVIKTYEGSFKEIEKR